MEDGLLRDCLVTYIEKEIAILISTDAIIDEFDEAPRRVDFNWEVLVALSPIV